MDQPINCCLKYTKVTTCLKQDLDQILDKVEKFYYSEFWKNRFKRRLKEEGLQYNPIEYDILLGTTSLLKEDTEFKVFDKGLNQRGVSNMNTMIALNVNLTNEDIIENVVMHEFGHRQYNQKEFNIIQELNHPLFKRELLEELSERDYRYFTDENELRQRIIPLVKEMVDNNWDSEQLYKYSNNLNIDDIKDIYSKEYIIHLLNNIL